jgi:4-amino-4-deoxy-L-arabinose transferase-like glycosyltransferase
MSKLAARQRYGVAALSVVLLLGALFRLHDLTKSTIAHVEVYVPGIKLAPGDLSDPRPRFNLADTITSCISFESHPPGYYIVMFGWTKLFGTGKWALRLPSVLFGIASLMLLWALGVLEKNRLAALLAAGMFAFNGLHIFWSQTAKMYAMACFLGLLSTYLLLQTTRGGSRQRVFQFLYLVVTLVGCWTVVFYWALFFTQILWVLINSLSQRRAKYGLIRWQILVFILGSPLWTIVAHQSGRPSYLVNNFLLNLGGFLQFGFLLEPTLFKPDAMVAAGSPLAVSMMAFLALVALFLLFVALKSKTDAVPVLPDSSGPSSVLLFLGGASAVTGIFLVTRLVGNSRRILATFIIPILLILLDLLGRRYWNRLQSWGERFSSHLPSISRLSLVSLQAVLPIAGILGMSLLIPIFASNTVLLFVPYFLFVLSKGLAFLIRQNRRWIFLVLMLAVFHTFSVIHYKQVLHDPRDYEGLARQWTAVLEDSDLIFVQRSWINTPIFYYMSADRYHFVGQGYVTAAKNNPGARIWFLSCGGLPPSPAMLHALEGYEAILSVEARRAKAVMYKRTHFP